MAQAWQTAAFRQLHEPLDTLLGAKTAKACAGLGMATLGDLLRHLPRHLMAGTDVTDLGSLLHNPTAEDYIALVAHIASVTVAGRPPQQRLEVRLTDGSGFLDATFFGRPPLIAYWQALLSRSQRGIFAGKLGWFRGQPQLAHPAFVMITPEGLIGSEKNTKMAQRVGRSAFIGLYPQSAKLPTWTIAECVDLGLAAIAGTPDPLPGWIVQNARLPGWEQAFQAAHLPQSRPEHDAARRRLLFDEAFATQVAMAYRRADSSRHTAWPRPVLADGLLAAFDARLPYQLTDGQRAAGEVLAAELDSAKPMQRLLQGEVGSGKTLVALRAMLQVIDAGGQAVLLAPTEVLAQQHAQTISQLLGDLATGPLVGAANATEVALLTGSLPIPRRRAALTAIATGAAGIIIGTHALLSEQVSFQDLGLVVVDEQHRFGVEQRNALTGRAGRHPHVLVMTATPIPRSVAMTVFGDLDSLTLAEIPLGRAEVTTTVVDPAAKPAWLERVWQRVKEEVAAGRQAYIVAPRIDPEAKSKSKDRPGSTAGNGATAGVGSVPGRGSSTGDGSAARPGSAAGDGNQPAAGIGALGSVLDLHAYLSAGPLQGLHLGLLHGRLPAAEKDAVMSRFAAGDTDVLIATSMVEVGLDVANATMMVICQAERFGISQLHQLRGRIGRGQYPGVCLLITGAEPDSPARQRLDLVAQTADGFALAEADLVQRREGDVLGTSQSGGRSSLKLLRVLDHADIIEQARGYAEEVVRRDPGLTDSGVADYIHEIELLAQTDLDEGT